MDDSNVVELQVSKWVAQVSATVIAAIIIAVLAAGFTMWRQQESLINKVGENTEQLSHHTQVIQELPQNIPSESELSSVKQINRQRYETIIARLDRIENAIDAR